MSPRRLDPGVVRRRLRLIDELLEVLAGMDGEIDLAGDAIRRLATERVLAQLVETAAGINEHVAAHQVGRPASPGSPSSECSFFSAR